jgi:hypothetical protein
MHIRKSGFSIGLIALAVLSTGCSTSNLRSDYDRSADFGSYETYNFMENAGPRSGNYESFFSQYMVEAITIEMEKRGYVSAAMATAPKPTSPSTLKVLSTSTSSTTRETSWSGKLSARAAYRRRTSRICARTC